MLKPGGSYINHFDLRAIDNTDKLPLIALNQNFRSLRSLYLNKRMGRERRAQVALCW